MKVEIWSDVACPWCYIGKRRFEAAAREFDEPIDVEWRSYQLDPSAPRIAERPIDEILARKYRASAERVRSMMERVEGEASGEGLDFDLRGAVQVNTFDAHRLLQFAKTKGVGDEMKERLFRAYFCEGATVIGTENLAELAEDVGLDRDEVAAVLESDAHADDVRNDNIAARQLGVTGVPFFLIDGTYGFAGAQVSETILAALHQVRELLTPGELADAPACDDDTCPVD